MKNLNLNLNNGVIIMQISREQLEDIKLSFNLKSNDEAYEWILETFPLEIFSRDNSIMELRKEAEEKLNK